MSNGRLTGKLTPTSDAILEIFNNLVKAINDYFEKNKSAFNTFHPQFETLYSLTLAIDEASFYAKYIHQEMYVSSPHKPLSTFSIIPFETILQLFDKLEVMFATITQQLEAASLNDGDLKSIIMPAAKKSQLLYEALAKELKESKNLADETTISTSNKDHPVNRVPTEVFWLILKNVPVRQYSELSRVSSFFKRVVNSEYVCSALMKRNFNCSPWEIVKKPKETNFQLFQRLHKTNFLCQEIRQIKSNVLTDYDRFSLWHKKDLLEGIEKGTEELKKELETLRAENQPMPLMRLD